MSPHGHLVAYLSAGLWGLWREGRLGVCAACDLKSTLSLAQRRGTESLSCRLEYWPLGSLALSSLVSVSPVSSVVSIGHSCAVPVHGWLAVIHVSLPVPHPEDPLGGFL